MKKPKHKLPFLNDSDTSSALGTQTIEEVPNNEENIEKLNEQSNEEGEFLDTKIKFIELKEPLSEIVKSEEPNKIDENQVINEPSNENKTQPKESSEDDKLNDTNGKDLEDQEVQKNEIELVETENVDDSFKQKEIQKVVAQDHEENTDLTINMQDMHSNEVKTEIESNEGESCKVNSENIKFKADFDTQEKISAEEKTHQEHDNTGENLTVMETKIPNTGSLDHEDKSKAETQESEDDSQTALQQYFKLKSEAEEMKKQAEAHPKDNEKDTVNDVLTRDVDDDPGANKPSDNKLDQETKKFQKEMLNTDGTDKKVKQNNSTTSSESKQIKNANETKTKSLDGTVKTEKVNNDNNLIKITVTESDNQVEYFRNLMK